MKDSDEKGKDLLRKLKEAGKPNTRFTLTLKLDNDVLSERVFTAEKYSEETVSETNIHFLMNDLIRYINNTLSEKEAEIHERKKAEQINKLWSNKEKGENKDEK